MKDLQSEPHRFDRDLAGEPFRRSLPLAPDEGKIGMGELSDEPRRRMAGRDVEIARLADGGLGRIGIGEHETGKPPGERRLADALAAADQPGVGETALAIGGEQFLFGGLMADQRSHMARMGRAGQGVGFGKIIALGLLHARSALSAPTGSSLASTADQIAAATSPSVAPPSMTTQRQGSAAAMSRKARRRV